MKILFSVWANFPYIHLLALLCLMLLGINWYSTNFVQEIFTSSTTKDKGKNIICTDNTEGAWQESNLSKHHGRISSIWKLVCWCYCRKLGNMWRDYRRCPFHEDPSFIPKQHHISLCMHLETTYEWPVWKYIWQQLTLG